MSAMQQPPGPPHGLFSGAGPTSPPTGGNYDWQYTQAPRPRASKALLAVVLAAVAISVASLGVAFAALKRPTPTSTTADRSVEAAVAADTTSADRALCTELAPLMGENDRFTNSYVDSGAPGTPARDAGTQEFIDRTSDWIGRAQRLLDGQNGIDPYFRRSLQRFIDDRHLLIEDLRPGPLNSSWKTLYEDSVGAYSGPLHICDRLGVTW